MEGKVLLSSSSWRGVTKSDDYRPDRQLDRKKTLRPDYHLILFNLLAWFCTLIMHVHVVHEDQEIRRLRWRLRWRRRKRRSSWRSRRRRRRRIRKTRRNRRRWRKGGDGWEKEKEEVYDLTSSLLISSYVIYAGLLLSIPGPFYSYFLEVIYPNLYRTWIFILLFIDDTNALTSDKSLFGRAGVRSVSE